MHYSEHNTTIGDKIGCETKPCILCRHRADSGLAPSQWEMSLQSNAISHWLGANLESALHQLITKTNHIHDIHYWPVLPWKWTSFCYFSPAVYCVLTRSLTHWSLGDLDEILDNFQANFNDSWLSYLLWNWTQINVTEPYWWRSVLVQVVAWCHQAGPMLAPWTLLSGSWHPPCWYWKWGFSNLNFKVIQNILPQIFIVI